MSAFYDVQLQWIRVLHQALRSPWMDGFFKAWDYVDTFYFTVIAVTLSWYLWDRRIGIRLFYLFIIGTLVVQSLKVVFHQPRPCQIDPLVGIVCSPSFGFPSGGSQTAAIVGGLIVLECRRALYRWLGILFALMLCFSRVYLGMHYFTDVLGGVALGCLLLIVYKKVFPLFEKNWEFPAVIFSFVPFLPVYLLSMPLTWGLNLCLITLGIACGLMTYTKKSEKNVESLILRIWQTLSVLAGTCVLFAFRHYFPQLNLLWSFSEGYWLSFLGAYLIKKI